jgi:hypothetical protein
VLPDVDVDVQCGSLASQHMYLELARRSVVPRAVVIVLPLFEQDGYTVVFTMGCTSAGNCPLNGGESSTVSFNLHSAKFCGTVSAIVVPQSSVALNIYQDAAFSMPKSDFDDGQTLYLTALVTSPAVSIVSTVVRQVTITVRLCWLRGD